MISSLDTQLVVALSRHGSLAAAARQLNISPSAISQRLSALETKLDVRLADRFGRSGIKLTAIGEYLAQQGALIEDQLECITGEISARKGLVAGTLKIVAPFGFGRRHIAPLVSAFHKDFPETYIDLTLSDVPTFSNDTPCDILIRVGTLRDSALKLHKLADNRRRLCASPSYLEAYGTPSHPHELNQHKTIVIHEDKEDATLWHFTSAAGVKHSARVKPGLSTNDGEAAVRWALDGHGILARSYWSIKERLDSGDLVELLPDWVLPDAPIVALTGAKPYYSRLEQEFLTFMKHYLKSSLNKKAATDILPETQALLP